MHGSPKKQATAHIKTSCLLAVGPNHKGILTEASISACRIASSSHTLSEAHGHRQTAAKPQGLHFQPSQVRQLFVTLCNASNFPRQCLKASRPSTSVKMPSEFKQPPDSAHKRPSKCSLMACRLRQHCLCTEALPSLYISLWRYPSTV